MTWPSSTRMQSKTALHGPAMFMANSGYILPGFPSDGRRGSPMASAVSSDDLPAFVVLPDPRGLPPGGAFNWGAGFLPAIHQGTVLEPPMPKSRPSPIFSRRRASSTVCRAAKAASSSKVLNRTARGRNDAQTASSRPASPRMSWRRVLQLSAPEGTERQRRDRARRRTLRHLDHEDIGPFGRQCLLARRLVERGVRFVQIFCGAENTTAKKIRPNWDSHEDLVPRSRLLGPILDTGAAALLTDLKSRGLLESTLVICTTEFGRQPAAQGAGKGRDQHPGAFTAWMAGGGIQGGTAYGSTDDLGFKAAENPAYCYDLHATALHLLGLEPRETELLQQLACSVG